MKPLVEVLLVIALYGVSSNAVYVDPPSEITLLPEKAEIVFGVIFNKNLFKNDSLIFTSKNDCEEQVLRDLQQVLYQSGENFHKCYSLRDDDIDKFLAIANKTELFQRFQQSIEKCSKENKTKFYEFNCYVQRVQDYLQKVYSYVHRPTSSLQYQISYQLALARYRKLTICTGGELKTMMEDNSRLDEAFAACS